MDPGYTNMNETRNETSRSPGHLWWLEAGVNHLTFRFSRGFVGSVTFRSQRAMRCATTLSLADLLCTVRQRPLLAVAIVTHLVTRSLASRCRERLLSRSF
jgi:hypothetical protein